MNAKALNRKKGETGEKLAKEFLEKLGYKIIAVNFRKKCGEIDIVADRNQNNIYFIEVKSRFQNNFGTPLEAINGKKMDKIAKVSELFLLEYPKIPKSINYAIISIEFLFNSSIKLIFFENGFD
jgi:putative endonuclease